MKTTPDGRHIVLYPPTVTQGQGNRIYAVSGPVWIEVPEGTTLTDAQELFCWGNEARKHWDKDYSEDVKSIQVTGSKGQKYTVTKRGPKWECQCRGFAFRRDCKHVQQLRMLIKG